MKKTDKIFSAFMIFTILFAIAGWALTHFAFPEFAFSAYWYIPAYFTLFYFVSYGILMKPTACTKDFIGNFMIFIVAKLLTSLTLLIVLLYNYSNEVVNICVTFLIYYFVLIVPEIYYNIILKKGTLQKK